jgi:hypothetical protein
VVVKVAHAFAGNRQAHQHTFHETRLGRRDKRRPSSAGTDVAR